MTQHLLLEVVLGGRTLRIADAEIDVYDADADEWLHYTAGIDALTVERSFDFLATASATPTVPVECLFPVDVAAEDAAGHRLALSPASLALWTEGDDYALRRGLVGGYVLDPEFGEQGEPVAFSIGPTAAALGALVIPTTHRVYPGTFATATALQLDHVDLLVSYPRIYGRPGWISATEWVTGSQLVWFAYGTSGTDYVAILAGHQVGQTYVMLSGDTNVAGEQFAVHHTVDGLGQQVAVIAKYADFPAAGALNTFVDAAGQTVYGILYDAFTNPVIGAPKTVFVAWTSPDADDTGGLSPLAGDLILDLLQRAGIAVDFGRFAAAAALLRGYRFDCVIDDPEALAVAWLQENVYPLLPISMASGADGDYPIVWRFDASAEDATVRLDADADPRISRAGKLKDAASKVANAFSIQYRYSVRTDSYDATVTRDATTCPYCAASQARYGRIEKALKTRNVYDEATATAMLGWMARAYTSPSRRVGYLVPSEYRLHEGQIAMLTDSRVSYADRLCLVEQVEVDGTGMDGVRLLFVADLLRDLLSG